MKNYTFIIPVFNEEKTIEKVINEIKKETLKLNIINYEIIVVDDNSTDLTFEIISKLSGVKILKNLNNFGYGFCLKRGILASSNENVIILDGDGTYPINQLHKLINLYDKGYDLVVGKRTGKNLNLTSFKKPMRILLKFLVEFATGAKIPDINSGYRIIKKDKIINKLNHLSNTFSFTTSMTMSFIYSRNTIAYTDINYDLRAEGVSSKVKIFKDSLRTVQYIIKIILRYDRIKLFVLMSIIQIFFFIIFLCLSFYEKNFLNSSLIFLTSSIVTFCIGMLSETNND